MVKINGEYWDIVFVDKYDPILYVGNNTYTLGVTVPNWRMILISNAISGDLLHHVLTHELWHAEMVSRNVYVPAYIEEVLCDIVADHELEVMNMARNVHNNLCEYYHKC